MDRPRPIAIVIPALNEARTIAKVVAAVKSFGTPVVVDDGSEDKTAELAASAGAVVVKHAENRGYDGALDSGFKKAKELGAGYVITFDADGQHTGESLKKVTDLISSRPDRPLIIGIRPKFQRHSERLFSLVTRARYRIHDPLCGLKAYPIELYDQLGHFDSYGSIGTELALFGAKKGTPLVQIEIPVKERMGRSRFGWSFRAEYRILRAMWLGITGKIR